MSRFSLPPFTILFSLFTIPFTFFLSFPQFFNYLSPSLSPLSFSSSLPYHSGHVEVWSRAGRAAWLARPPGCHHCPRHIESTTGSEVGSAEGERDRKREREIVREKKREKKDEKGERKREREKGIEEERYKREKEKE